MLYGIGGVGKTTLAAELIRRVTERDPGRLAVIAASSLTGGTVSVDRLLAAMARALRRRSDGTRPALDQAADRAERHDLAWQDRLTVLREDALDVMPVLLVLDNFEDNLTPASAPGRPGWRTVADQDLAALLAALATQPGRCRLLITSRYPFVLPGQAERVLSFQPIGPLSQAETMKLAWALPALDKLTEPELERVWQMVGGHPRCLEYLDALLSGGHSSYPDVTTRLAANLAARPDIPDLDEWFATHGTLDQALAETLTLAADEVLLDQLLAGLAATPGAEDLLLGLSVYRSPVGQAGLLFQIGTSDPSAETRPDYAVAHEQIHHPHRRRDTDWPGRPLSAARHYPAGTRPAPRRTRAAADPAAAGTRRCPPPARYLYRLQPARPRYRPGPTRVCSCTAGPPANSSSAGPKAAAASSSPPRTRAPPSTGDGESKPGRKTGPTISRT